VSALQSIVRSRTGELGGIVGYPLDLLHEEVAFIAYHFHWSREQLLELEHDERRRWVDEIAKLLGGAE
jgi:hypothetical protein